MLKLPAQHLHAVDAQSVLVLFVKLFSCLLENIPGRNSSFDSEARGLLEDS